MLATRQDTLFERAVLLVMVWIVLGLEALVLHGMVRPYASRWGWLRVLPCVAGAGLLWLGLMMMDIADAAPPFAYTIGLFPILAALAFMAIALRRGVGWVVLRLGEQRRPST